MFETPRKVPAKWGICTRNLEEDLRAVGKEEEEEESELENWTDAPEYGGEEPETKYVGFVDPKHNPPLADYIPVWKS